MMKFSFTLPIMTVAAFALGACGTVPEVVPREYVDATLLDRNPIDVVETAETIEIVLDPSASELSLADARRLRGFVRAYNDHGHGPLVMLLPEGTTNQQFAVGAVAQARAIAFENGVNYEEIEGGAKFGAYPSIILSFKAYDSVAPECKGFGEIDFAEIRSNNDLPNLGCSIRTNLAAMIADPADLLGTRELDPADSGRGQRVFDAYRAGEATGSEGNEGESGTVSDAIAGQ